MSRSSPPRAGSQLTISGCSRNGQSVVIAEVHESNPSTKPCRVAATGTAYLRSYDGDFALSAVEEQGFLVARRPPHFDREPVDGASRNDLDPALVAAFVTVSGTGIAEAWAVSTTTANCCTAPEPPSATADRPPPVYWRSVGIRRSSSLASSSRPPPSRAPTTPRAYGHVTRPPSPVPSLTCSTRPWPGPAAPSAPRSPP